VVSLPVLVALGVKDTGEKVLLALATGGAETAAAWQMMLEDLAAWHLGRPQLVISDGNPGLKSALERLWPGVAHQRCTVHPSADGRNLLAKAPEHAQEAIHEEYHRIIYAANRAAAERARESFLVKWRKLCPSLAANLVSPDEVHQDVFVDERHAQALGRNGPEHGHNLRQRVLARCQVCLREGAGAERCEPEKCATLHGLTG
jgi:transposase-like protein